MKFRSATLFALKDVSRITFKDCVKLIKSIPDGTFNYPKYMNSIHKSMGTFMNTIDYLYQLPYFKVITIPFFMCLLFVLLVIFDILCFILTLFGITE